MPSGAKKRKAAKRKKEMAIHHHSPDSPTNPNPNPNPNSIPNPPPISLHHQGNGHEGGSSTSQEKHSLTEEEEAEEKFETPSLQADSVDIPMESLGNGGEEVKEEFHPSKDGDVSVEFVLPEKRDETRIGDEGLKQTKLEESDEKNVIQIEQSVLVTENPKTLVESVDTLSQEREVDVLPQPDEGIPSKDGVVSFNFVQYENRDDGGNSLEGTIRINYSKETELDKSIEKSVISEEQSAVVTENPETLVEEVDASSHEREAKVLPPIYEGLKEMKLDKSAAENFIPIEKFVPITKEVIYSSKAPAENYKDLVEAVDTSSHEGEVKVLTRLDEEIPYKDGVVSVEFVQAEKGDDDDDDRSLEGGNLIDERSKEMKLEKTGEDKFVTIEQSVPDEVSPGSEVSAENFKALVGAVDTSSSHEREVKVLTQHDETREPLLDATRTEIATRSEVARTPVVVHRASVWNCCGLFDVLTGYQR